MVYPCHDIQFDCGFGCFRRQHSGRLCLRAGHRYCFAKYWLAIVEHIRRMRSKYGGSEHSDRMLASEKEQADYSRKLNRKQTNYSLQREEKFNNYGQDILRDADAELERARQGDRSGLDDALDF